MSLPPRSEAITTTHYMNPDLRAFKEPAMAELDRILKQIELGTTLGSYKHQMVIDNVALVEYDIDPGNGTDDETSVPTYRVRISYVGSGGGREEEVEGDFKPYFWCGVRSIDQSHGTGGVSGYEEAYEADDSAYFVDAPQCILHVLAPQSAAQQERPYDYAMMCNGEQFFGGEPGTVSNENFGPFWIYYGPHGYAHGRSGVGFQSEDDWMPYNGRKVISNNSYTNGGLQTPVAACGGADGITGVILCGDYSYQHYGPPQWWYASSQCGLVAPSQGWVNSERWCPEAASDVEWERSVFLDPDAAINFSDLGEPASFSMFGASCPPPDGADGEGEFVGVPPLPGNYQIYIGAVAQNCSDHATGVHLRVVVGKSSSESRKSSDGTFLLPPSAESLRGVQVFDFEAPLGGCFDMATYYDMKSYLLGGNPSPVYNDYPNAEGAYGENNGNHGYYQGAIQVNIKESVIYGAASSDDPEGGLFPAPYFDRGYKDSSYARLGACYEGSVWCGLECSGSPCDYLSNGWSPEFYPWCWSGPGGKPGLWQVDARGLLAWQLAVVTQTKREGEVCEIQFIGDPNCGSCQQVGTGSCGRATGTQVFGATYIAANGIEYSVSADSGFAVGDLVCVVGWGFCLTQNLWLVTPAVQPGYDFTDLYFSQLRCPDGQAMTQYMEGLVFNAANRTDGPQFTIVYGACGPNGPSVDFIF